MTETPAAIDTFDLPGAAALGPYSDAVVSGGIMYLSGRIGLDPRTGALVEGTTAVQTRQCLSNIAAVLALAGLDSGHVLKTTVFLTDMAEFAAMNAEYASFFGDHRPARSTVAVAGLPLGAAVEVEVVASTAR